MMGLHRKVISTLLWNVVVNKILLKLNKNAIADKFVSTINELIKSGLEMDLIEI